MTIELNSEEIVDVIVALMAQITMIETIKKARGNITKSEQTELITLRKLVNKLREKNRAGYAVDKH